MARAFLRTQAALFGSYRNALQIEPVSHTEGEQERVGRGEGGREGLQLGVRVRM